MIPGLEICPWSIHIADDVSNVANDSCKYKDSKKKHESSENIFLQRILVQPSIKNSTHENFVAGDWCNEATVKNLKLSFRTLAITERITYNVCLRTWSFPDRHKSQNRPVKGLNVFPEKQKGKSLFLATLSLRIWIFSYVAVRIYQTMKMSNLLLQFVGESKRFVILS